MRRGDDGRWSPAREVAAWARATRGALLTLVAVAAALVVLRVAGPRGLLATVVVGALVWWLARLGRPRR